MNILEGPQALLHWAWISTSGLTYRTFVLEAPVAALLAAVVPPVRSLNPDKRHAINEPSKTSASKALRELKKIKMAWPGLELLDGSVVC